MSTIMEQIASAFKGKSSGNQPVDVSGMAVLAVALLCVVAPLELGQLAFAFVGALCYAGLQITRKSTRTSLKNAGAGKKIKDVDMDDKKRAAQRSSRQERPKKDVDCVGKRDVLQQSVQPVSAPVFCSNDFEEQVQELIGQIAPSKRGDKVVQDLAAAVKETLSHFIPEAEVMGFASGDVLRGTAFAVAIPEVDIIVNVTPSVMAERLMHRTSRPLPHAAKLDAWKLQKSMLRACTDELTYSPIFKFRRSSFKGLEPKVTLMAELNGRAMPLDFSVNTVTPLYNGALLTECGKIEPRAKELILLVRRWAKDRGISHAAKGHLSPYAWSLLTIYFLQVWDVNGGPLLPELTAFKMASSLLRKQQKQQAQSERSPESEVSDVQAKKLSVACLFKGFIQFYKESFDWRNEAISVRAGKRQAPATSLPLHIVTLESGITQVAPSVQDPFEQRRNLGSSMTGVTVDRLQEEIRRADLLLTEGAALSELLEPWVPSAPMEGDANKAAESPDAEA